MQERPSLGPTALRGFSAQYKDSDSINQLVLRVRTLIPKVPELSA